MQKVITCTDSHVTMSSRVNRVLVEFLGSGLGPPRPRRPLAFVQPCPMAVTPLRKTLFTFLKLHSRHVQLRTAYTVLLYSLLGLLFYVEISTISAWFRARTPRRTALTPGDATALTGTEGVQQDHGDIKSIKYDNKSSSDIPQRQRIEIIA